MRHTFVLIHRWAGLFTAVFLFIAGLTGAVISWDHELDEWLNPHLFDAKGTGTPRPPLDLVAKVESADPRAAVTFFPLAFEEGHTAALGVAPRVDPKTATSSRSTTTKRSSSRRRARSWASASGARSRSTPRTCCPSSISCITPCTSPTSPTSTAGACG